LELGGDEYIGGQLLLARERERKEKKKVLQLESMDGAHSHRRSQGEKKNEGPTESSRFRPEQTRKDPSI
jgi:hypothetical protein